MRHVPRPQLLTFDVYSALLDVEGSLAPHVATLWPDVAEQTRRHLVREWRRLQLEYTLIATLLDRGHVPFRVVTERALRVAAHRIGLPLHDEAVPLLVAAWEALNPWPDAVPALERLREGPWQLALLSNGDRDMLERAARALGVPFDHIFSAEEAGVYKPHPAIYMLPVSRLGVDPHVVLHVAGSARDVMGAKAAGLRCAWVRRRADLVFDPSLAADIEVPSLTDLANMLLGEPPNNSS